MTQVPDSGHSSRINCSICMKSLHLFCPRSRKARVLHYITQSIKRKLYRVKNIGWKLILRCNYQLYALRETTANDQLVSRVESLNYYPIHPIRSPFIIGKFERKFRIFFYFSTFSTNWLIVDDYVSRLRKIIIERSNWY